MGEQVVRRVQALWLSPVTSMLGEWLQQALLVFRARLLTPPQPEAPQPPVVIAAPRSEAAPLLSSDPAVPESLSQRLGRRVCLLDRASEPPRPGGGGHPAHAAGLTGSISRRS